MRALYADKSLPLGRTGPMGRIVGGRLVAMVWWIAGIVLSGCSSESLDSGAMNLGGLEPAPVDTVPVSPVLVDADTLTEALQACDMAQPIRAHQYLCLREGSLTWVDEVSGTTGLMEGVAELAGAAHGDDVLLIANGLPYMLDGTGVRDVNWSVPVPIERLESHGEDLWMLGSGRLFALSNSSVTELSIEGVEHIYGFAVADDTVYIRAPNWMAVDRSALSSGVTAMGELPADALATDAGGGLWWLSQGRVFHRSTDGVAQEVAMPEAILDIVGPDIWLVGETQTYRVHDAAMEVHAIVATGAVGVDAYGRLLRSQDGQLIRHSAGRPVVVTGLSDSLMVSETLTLLPSDPDSVDTLSAWVNDQPLTVSEEPFQVTLNPEHLGDGAHSLRFFTTSGKGDHMATHPLWVGALPEVEWAEIQALSQAHCDRCHGGDTLTDLTTPLGWEQRIDEIIMLVSTEQMPLGGPFLSDEEIVLIRAWKHGGFQ